MSIVIYKIIDTPAGFYRVGSLAGPMMKKSSQVLPLRTDHCRGVDPETWLSTVSFELAERYIEYIELIKPSQHGQRQRLGPLRFWWFAGLGAHEIVRQHVRGGGAPMRLGVSGVGHCFDDESMRIPNPRRLLERRFTGYLQDTVSIPSTGHSRECPARALGNVWTVLFKWGKTDKPQK